MKKIYSAPKIEIIHVAFQRMLADSQISIGSGTVDQESGVLTHEESDWDIW